MNRSRIVRKIISLITLMLLLVNAFGQNKGAQITKEEIISKAWKAMFGELKNEDIKSIYIEGYFHGRDIPNKTTVKRPNLFRNEITNSVLVFDGQRAADINKGPDKDGNPQVSEILDSPHWKHFEVDIALYMPAFFEYPAELKGIDKNEEAETYELYVELPLGGNMTYFIDTKSFLITRRLVCYSGDRTNDLWENIITKYAEFNGVIFTSEFTYKTKEGEETAFLKNVKFNVNPADELFKIPDGL